MTVEDIINQLNKATGEHYIAKRDSKKPLKTFGSFNSYSITLYKVAPKDVINIFTVQVTASQSKEEVKEQAELETIYKLFKMLIE